MKKIIKNNPIFYWILPFVLGLASSFSLPPYNFIFINFFTFPILLFIVFELRKLKKRKYHFFKLGWIFGFGYFFSNIYWIVFSLTFDDIFKNFIPIGLFLIPAFLAIFYGLVIFFLFRLNINKKLSSVLIFSLVFSIIEFIRGNILTGFPWNFISFSWTSSVNSIQILSLIGTYSFNLISITIFTLPFVFLFKDNKKIQLGVFLFLVLFISSNYIYGYKIIKNSNKEKAILKEYSIKIVSPKISIKEFLNNSNEKEILIDLITLSNPEKNKPTIFIWPEGVLTGIYFEELKNKYNELFLNNFSKKHIIVMGINTYDFENGVEKIYNSMVVVNNNLELLSKYNKNKLVPFGEFLPFETFLNKLGLKKVTYGYQSFSKSNERNIISINSEIFNINFLPLICYEIIYSGLLKPNKKNFDLIINISEDGWFGDSIGPDQHFSHSIFRAVEEGKNIIRSANNGVSAILIVKEE